MRKHGNRWKCFATVDEAMKRDMDILRSIRMPEVKRGWQSAMIVAALEKYIQQFRAEISGWKLKKKKA